MKSSQTSARTRAVISRSTVFLCSLVAVASWNRCEAQMLETETARLLHEGSWKWGAAFEVQHSSQGTETAFPLFIEYGLLNSLELAVEPVPFTAIRPKEGHGATGLGDVEVTLTYLCFEETSSTPAFAVAAEVKAPTANNEQIGTGALPLPNAYPIPVVDVALVRRWNDLAHGLFLFRCDMALARR